MPPRTRYSRRQVAVDERTPVDRSPADIEEGTAGRSRRVEAATVEAEDSEQTISNSVPSNSEEYETTRSKPMLPLRMYFNPSQYGKKMKLSTRCYLTEAVATLTAGLKYPLEEDDLNWFLMHPQFKHFFHMPQANNHKLNGIWMLFLRTASTEKKREAWFIVNGVPISYGRKEHALMSGLSCRSYPHDFLRLGSMEFADKMFGKNVVVTYNTRAKRF